MKTRGAFWAILFCITVPVGAAEAPQTIGVHIECGVAIPTGMSAALSVPGAGRTFTIDLQTTMTKHPKQSRWLTKHIIVGQDLKVRVSDKLELGPTDLFAVIGMLGQTTKPSLLLHVVYSSDGHGFGGTAAEWDWPGTLTDNTVCTLRTEPETADTSAPNEHMLNLPQTVTLRIPSVFAGENEKCVVTDVTPK